MFTSTSRVSRSVQATNLPPIPIASKWAAAYKGTDLINLAQGVPGSEPHVLVAQRLSEVVKLGQSAAYGDIFGDGEMRKALVEEMKYVYGGQEADVKFEDVALTAGCNAAFMAAVLAIAERGDEVILPVPWYFNQQMTLQMLGIGIVPLPVSIEDGFVPSIERAESLVTPRTKAIVLTGVIYPPSLIHSFSSLASKHNIFLIIDETYRDFVAPNPPHSLFTHPDWRTTIIHLFSFSKSYRVPGHRLGALVAGTEVLENVEKVLDCMQICPARPLQMALAPLLPSLRSDLADQLTELTTRHTVFQQTLVGSGDSGWQIGSAGAYFALVKHPFEGKHATEVCKWLAEECGIVLLPLSFFAPADDSAWDSWIRVSVANVGTEAVREAAVRLRESGKMLGWSDLIRSRMT